MALSDKNIVITPNVGSAADPQIVFSGASSTLGPQNITLRAYPTSNGTLSFEGSAGQLFSITNSLSGTIFSVNDVSGIPSIEVLDTGLIKLAQFSGRVLMRTGTDNGTSTLQVAGAVASTSSITGTVVVTGGVGISGDLNVSGSFTTGSIQNTPIGSITRSTGAFTTLAANAAVTFTAGTASTTTATGTLVVTGGIGASGNITAASFNTFTPSQTAGAASRIVVADANGYIFNNYFNSTDNSVAASVSGVMVKQGDNYYRTGTAQAIGTFISGTTMNIAGNAATATTLQTARTIGGVSFNGSINIDLPGVNTAGNQNTTGSATSLNSSNFISRTGSSGNLNTDFSNTPAGTIRHSGDDAGITNNPGGSWWFHEHHRHSNASSTWGTQVAWGWEDNANRLATRNVTANTFGAWVYYLNSSNFTTYAPSLTGTGASGTWGINITGTATNLSTGFSNWSTNGTISAVVGQLAWKNYGNNHTIFDASQSTDPNGTAINNATPQVAWTGTYPTLMGWNGANTYGVRVNAAERLLGAEITTGAAATPGTVTGTWTLSAGSTWQATFADLAEYYPSDVEYESGTVVIFGGQSELTISTQANDRKIAGVVSTDPAYIMNAACLGPRVCMALQGRVPVNVIGTVERGDMLVSSATPGYAMVNNSPNPGCVIGKAIESKTTEGPGQILVSVNI